MNIKTQHCKKCNKELPIDMFYIQRNGVPFNKCKDCYKADVKENRKSKEEYYKAYDRNRPNKDERNSKNKERQRDNPEAHKLANEKWLANNKKKREAQVKVSNAVRDGLLEKLPCFVCGELVVEGHHPDYDAPLDVVWLCVKHHKEIHRKHDYNNDKKLLEQTIKGNRWAGQQEVMYD